VLLPAGAAINSVIAAPSLRRTSASIVAFLLVRRWSLAVPASDVSVRARAGERADDASRFWVRGLRFAFAVGLLVCAFLAVFVVVLVFMVATSE